MFHVIIILRLWGLQGKQNIKMMKNFYLFKYILLKYSTKHEYYTLFNLLSSCISSVLVSLSTSESDIKSELTFYLQNSNNRVVA